MKRSGQLLRATMPSAMSSKKSVDTRVGKPKREWRAGEPVIEVGSHPVRRKRNRFFAWLRARTDIAVAYLKSVDVHSFITGTDEGPVYPRSDEFRE